MYRFLLFDLFGTVVLFRPEAPVARVGPAAWRSTMHYLRADVARELPGTDFDAFADAMRAVTEEIVASREPEQREVLSQERFRRVLLRLGVTGEEAERRAERLCLAHMGYLASRVDLPQEHGDMLRRLCRTHPMGLVSNFDHAPTARGILARHGIADVFLSTVISADFGRRKPHRSIFEYALAALGGTAREALFVGDSPIDDVAGAHAAGIDVVWINRGNDPLPPGLPEPRWVVRSLVEVEEIVRR